LIYRQTEKRDIAGMARLRAEEWGTQDYWETRIAAYLDGELHPQKALRERAG